MNLKRTFLVVFLVLLCSGCAVVPVPFFGHTGDFKKIEAGSVKFIKIGSTRKEDVLLQLGAPDWVNSDSFAYNIEKYRGGWFGFFLTPIGGGAGGELRKFRWSLLIKFDNNSAVKGHRFIDEWTETEHYYYPIGN